MRKFFSISVTAIFLSTMLATSPAQANHNQIGPLIGGFVAGAIIGGVIANQHRGGHYGAQMHVPAPMHVYPPAYVVPAPRCYTRQGVVLDQWGQPRRAWIRECF